MSIVIRPCRTFEELDACVALQSQVWGFEDADVIPRRALVVARKIGGQVIGAFDQATLIGFAMALPGVLPGNPPGCYLHSHMLAVDPRYRNQGIGRQLKLAQREDALARHLQQMEWTFDPLEIKNSFLNIEKLGAIVRRYTPDHYGVSSSRLQAGLPTDRLHAEWWMRSSRVNAILSGGPRPIYNIEQTILIPAEIAQWKTSEATFAQAAEAQLDCRSRFQAAFARGLAVVGFKTDSRGNGIFELASWQPSWKESQ